MKNESFSTWLSLALDRKKWTLRDLCDKTGLSWSTLYKIAVMGRVPRRLTRECIEKAVKGGSHGASGK